MARIRHREGDWFAVPLENPGFAVGLIARSTHSSGLLGYFFGPRVASVPRLPDVASLRADDAVLVATFSHLGIQRGEWPVIGRLDGWDRSHWPMPVFVRQERLTGRTFRVFYDPDDPSRRLREELVPTGEEVVGPADSAMGAGFVEKRLTRLVG